MNMKITQGSMRPRSATAPVAMATLYTKISWDPQCVSVEVTLRDGSEHALIHRIQQIRDPAAPHARLCQHLHEAEVIKSAEKLASLVREGE